jgi:hypothetical protein
LYLLLKAAKFLRHGVLPEEYEKDRFHKIGHYFQQDRMHVPTAVLLEVVAGRANGWTFIKSSFLKTKMVYSTMSGTRTYSV